MAICPLVGWSKPPIRRKSVRLATARRPQQGEKLILGDGQIDMAQRMVRGGTLAINPGQPNQLACVLNVRQSLSPNVVHQCPSLRMRGMQCHVT